MKKILFPAAVLLMLCSCNKMKKEIGETVKSDWPTLTDTIIYPSVKDPKKMDTLLLKSGVDTTLEIRTDTIMAPSPNPPYDLQVTPIKVGPRMEGRKIDISKF
jgi:hypothetical protein